MTNYPITEFMIDIETLDTKPSAVVLSLGVVSFNQEVGAMDNLFIQLDGQEQLDCGRTVSMDTIKFWMRQPEASRRAAFPDDPQGMFEDIAHFISHHKSPEGALYWAKSPSFDMTILYSLCGDLYGVDEMPWAFRGFRDVRTLVDAVHDDFVPAKTWDYPDHHPIGDCLWQIEEVRHVRKIFDRTP